MRYETLTKAEEDPSGTAALLLDAAEEVFAEHGYGAASTREIARRAGVPFGALHYHWGSKQQLRQAVHARAIERFKDTIGRGLAVGHIGGAAIDTLVDVVDAGTLCREHFLLDSANRQHIAAEGNLACHRGQRTNLLACQQRHQCGHNCYAGRRTIFWNCARRNVNVDVMV